MENLELQKVLAYEGNVIEINEVGMWNATQMAKPFGKQASKWFDLESTKEYLKKFSKSRNLLMVDLVRVSRGGNNLESTGTWIHEKLVIKFAQWINIEFELWCNEQLETLMREGSVSIQKKLPQNYVEALKALIIVEEEKILLLEENAQHKELISAQEEVIELQEPLVEFSQQIAESSDCILVRQLAKLAYEEKIQIGEKKLYSWLREKKILNRNNEPYQSYIDRGFLLLKETIFNTPYGTKTNTTTMVTGSGQIYIIQRLKKEFSKKNDLTL